MEFVYVTKRYDLFDLSFPHGFLAASDDDRVALWTDRIRQRGFFVERRWAEQDSSFKQIIPYTVMVHGDDVLLLQRKAAGGEARLHGKLSIGVGGHINPVDGDDGTCVLEQGCRRELNEELCIDTPYALAACGVINDESADVGSVHFGLVYVARCETPDVAIRETDQLSGSFVPRAECQRLVSTERERFETWSALIIEHLDDLLG
jgi:predicted NUDIX family phosphoesterase